MGIATQPFMRPELGWQLLSGDFFTGPEGENYFCLLFISDSSFKVIVGLLQQYNNQTDY